MENKLYNFEYDVGWHIIKLIVQIWMIISRMVINFWDIICQFVIKIMWWKNGLVSNKCFGFDINYSSERLYFIIDYPSKTTLKMLKAFAYKQLQKGYSKEFVCCVVYASELIDKGFVFIKTQMLRIVIIHKKLLYIK